MPSRLQAIRSKVATHVDSVFSSSVTIIAESKSLSGRPKQEYPLAIILFEEEEPERLEFKQERRRVVGQVQLAMLIASDATEQEARELLDLKIEAIRDAIAADWFLTSTVDNVSCGKATTLSGAEDSLVYGVLDVVAEEVF